MEIEHSRQAEDGIVEGGFWRSKNQRSFGRIIHREDEEQFLCPLCKEFLEDSLHLLVNCNVAVKAWRESPWAIQLNMLHLENILS